MDNSENEKKCNCEGKAEKNMSAAPAEEKAEENCENESEKKQEGCNAPAEQCEKEGEEKECKGGHEKGHCRKELQKAKEEIEKLKAEAEDLKRKWYSVSAEDENCTFTGGLGKLSPPYPRGICKEIYGGTK